MQKKSLVSALKTTKKANIAKEKFATLAGKCKHGLRLDRTFRR